LYAPWFYYRSLSKRRHESETTVRPRLATAVVFGTSFSVLVLEILAGRLLAPLIGVSLETFTGIIGTVLAGIALGSAVGGRLADRRDPAHLIGPAVAVGGVLTWVAPVLVSALDGLQSSDPFSIVLLAGVTFFAPAAVLSSVTPMVAKLLLSDLDETGRTVGNLSAAGTAGALTGTFLTGFVLVAAVSTRTLMFAVGAALVVAGTLLTAWSRSRVNPLFVVLAAAAGLGALTLSGSCDTETGYACVELVVDPANPAGRTLVLNRSRNSYVDVDDPTHLEFRYLRLFAAVIDGTRPGPIEGLHLGGAGFTFPRYLNATRSDSSQTVLEIDGPLVDFTQRELGLGSAAGIEVVVGDARLTIADLPDRRFDVVSADAFSGLTVPWHLTTDEFVAELDRVLRADGIVVMNVIDGGDLDFVRAEIATYGLHFENVIVIAPPGGTATGRARNYVLVVSHQAIPLPEINPADGEILDPAQTQALAAGAEPLTDDFAPVDQMRRTR